ncbi:sulfite exporter TauE/SafE family protein [Candidatus Sumerlaeota bacterium]|nr:sulfite exporter TauE/SafE family protein [Candidatus Sumerlaeota bacterium]
MLADLTSLDWTLIVVCAFVIGIAKTGIPGAGILSAPVLAAILPPKPSTGFVLPMLIIADTLAVVYWRRDVKWKHLTKLLPIAAAGIVLGWLLMDRISNRWFGPLIGAIVAAMLAINYWRNAKWEGEPPVPEQWWFPVAVGLLAGLTTMMANAAGPVMALYLLAMRLPKEEFIGTGAWFFIVVNCFKVPFQLELGHITLDTFKVNLALAPVIFAGGVTGIIIVRRLPQKYFVWIIEVLTALAALNLIFPVRSLMGG